MIPWQSPESLSSHLFCLSSVALPFLSIHFIPHYNFILPCCALRHSRVFSPLIESDPTIPSFCDEHRSGTSSLTSIGPRPYLFFVLRVFNSWGSVFSLSLTLCKFLDVPDIVSSWHKNTHMRRFYSLQPRVPLTFVTYRNATLPELVST